MIKQTLATFLLIACYFNGLGAQKIVIANNLLPQENNWKYYTARYDVDATMGNQSIAGALNVRMKRDSIFWFSFSVAMGIQVAKGMLVNDTLHILDLYNKNYYAFPVKEASAYLSIPLGVQHIQKLFTGQPLADSSNDCSLSNNLLCFKTLANPIQILSHFANTKNTVAEIATLNNSVNADVVANFNQLRITEISNPSNPKEKATLYHEDWTKTQSTENSGFGALPYTIKINTINDQDNAQVKLSLINARFDPIPSYPFRVSSEYTKQSLPKK